MMLVLVNGPAQHPAEAFHIGRTSREMCGKIRRMPTVHETPDGTPKPQDYEGLKAELAALVHEIPNRPGFAGGSGYWIATSGWSVRCAS